MKGPNPNTVFPLAGYERLCFLKNSEEQICTLLEICWWNWDMEKITRNIALLTGNDVEALRAAT